MKKISCCFTGHRNIPRNRYESIKNRISDEIEKAYGDGYRRFLCGGALGFDTLCAKVILEKRKVHSDIKLILVIPCMEQDAKWCEADREVYRDIYRECDECYCMSERYTPSCMHLRNRAMVNESSLVIAYLETDSGGTAYTCRYAAKCGVKTVNIAYGG